jgi:hypothetical protein
MHADNPDVKSDVLPLIMLAKRANWRCALISIVSTAVADVEWNAHLSPCIKPFGLLTLVSLPMTMRALRPTPRNDLNDKIPSAGFVSFRAFGQALGEHQITLFCGGFVVTNATRGTRS